MTTALHFLIAARDSEIQELEQLARTGALVDTVAALIHALQRERGLSNLMLASSGVQGEAARATQAADSDRCADAVREAFAPLAPAADAGGGCARLFGCIAEVLHGLDGLPGLRTRIAALALSPDEAALAFKQLIAALLALIFEAADGATDAEVSRMLAALFHLMQGKELCGQERACGTAAFAAGRIDAPHRQQWLELIAVQEHCLAQVAVFRDDDRAPALCDGAAAGVQLERLRRIGCAASADGTLDAALGPVWFDASSARIDALKTSEDQLVAGLRALCAHKAAQARQAPAGLASPSLAERSDAVAATLAAQSAWAREEAGVRGDTAGAALPCGPRLARSVMEQLRSQSRQLRLKNQELATARATLEERKRVERAKGLLMAHRRLEEAQAHKLLRDTAMQQNRRLVEVADSVLTLTGLLETSPGPDLLSS